ncbi:hypothetical protein NPat_gp70 [Klebsiella phage NPat]|uniref:Uncharacterized protein n=1 Tax=Klebsiella phage NPat TaxID=2935708 RepID=A0AAE9KWL9_9CAUD|nr:hypothetical protein NPat_gp70 [Klebsiella phage NPat]
MIYAIIALSVLVLILYACGCFLMRALLKELETTDKDDLYPVLCWPFLMIAAVGDLIISRNFKW